MNARATIYFQNETDLEIVNLIFSRLNIFIRDFEVDNSPPKNDLDDPKKVVNLEKHLPNLIDRYKELYQKLAESERIEPRFEINLKDLHEIDVKTIEPILKRLAFDFSKNQTR
jgi:hypothetical protein